MDLMLIASPTNARSPYMPFYYLYIAGYMEKYGISVTIVDPHFRHRKENIDYILDQVKLHNPRYIGLSCFVTDYNVVYDLATKIKTISNAIILVGNAQPSIAPDDFLFDGSPFDIVVRGEGEVTVREIVTSFCDPPTYKHIDGIAFFDGKSVVITKNRQLMSLSDLGKPAYHLLDMHWYARPTKHIIRRLAAVCAVIYTGRGCPYSCNFCASNVVWGTNDKSPGNSLVRSRPISDVMEELELLQNKYGFDFFYVLDDTFGIRESSIIEFCNAYKKSGLKMLWAAESRVNCIKKPEIVQLLKDSGCIQLDFGVESGSPKILKLVNKMITVDETVTAFDLCRKYGLRTFANLLLNMPQENEEDIELSHQLLNRIRPTYVSIGLTQPYPGTAIYKALGKKIDKTDYHLLDREFPPDEYRLCSHKLDLPRLLSNWRFKYKTYTLFERSMITAGTPYWRKILTSRSRLKYLAYWLKDFIGTALYYLKIRYITKI